jgi:hypothetical protein
MCWTETSQCGSSNSAGATIGGSTLLHRRPDDQLKLPLSTKPPLQEVANYDSLRPGATVGCRDILAEIKANHDANTAESLARNMSLIHELNSNISKARNFVLVALLKIVHQCPMHSYALQVVGLYNDVSSDFQQYMEKRRQGSPMSS